MAEWRFYPVDEIPEVSTQEWHNDREAAPHLEQEWHQPRLAQTREFAATFISGNQDVHTLVDLGCGDGGFLFTVKDLPVTSYGYDFMPLNIQYAREVRGVDARFGNFLEDDVDWGQPRTLVVATEVIEHLDKPHEFLQNLSTKVDYLVCSSPNNESDQLHCPEHTWAWDNDGYGLMLYNAGWRDLRVADLYPFQVWLCFSTNKD